MLSEPPPPTCFLLPMDRLDACARLHAGQLVSRRGSRCIPMYPLWVVSQRDIAPYEACCVRAEVVTERALGRSAYSIPLTWGLSQRSARSD